MNQVEVRGTFRMGFSKKDELASDPSSDEKLVKLVERLRKNI
jgi:hypothetical protein